MNFNLTSKTSPFFVVAFLGTATSALAQVPVTSGVTGATTLTERSLEREKALGLERIVTGPNEFQYALPADLETPSVIEEKGVISIYEGQSTFDARGSAPSARLIMAGDEAAASPVEDMIGSIRIDEYGRRWRAVDVDRGSLMDAIASYDALVERSFGQEPGAESSDPFQRRAAESTDRGLAMWRPMSWTKTDCDGDGEDDIRRYGSDDRSLAASPMTTRQKKVVLIQGNRWGSGVMVDSNTVLTAAHVVTNASGSAFATSSFDVLTLGNYQAGAVARTVTSITLPGGYTGDGDFNDDYALLHLNISPSVGWMAISRASNATIKAADSYNAGYPGFTPGCVANLVGGTLSSFWGVKQYWSKGDLFGTTAKRVKTRLDSGPGHSGSPIYYYPSGCCGSHYVTGVLAGHVDFWIGTDYTGGPKGSAIRSWVIANM
ncbi:MAG: serine protease [Planctomycetota bacterium]|nr:serine protease [Planctomycetota bacterium]